MIYYYVVQIRQENEKSNSKISALSNQTIILCSVNGESYPIIWMLERLLFWRFFGHFEIAFPILFHELLALAFPFARTVAFFYTICNLAKSKVSDPELRVL
jgi:hypothetical protein